MNIFAFLRLLFFGEPYPKSHQTKSGNIKTKINMNKLVENIKEETQYFLQEIYKFDNGNKAAGLRARKSSLKLEKLYKEFRKRSVHETPNND